jgi:hypothetical protein
VAAEGEHGQGDEGLWGAEPEGDPGEEALQCLARGFDSCLRLHDRRNGPARHVGTRTLIIADTAAGSNGSSSPMRRGESLVIHRGANEMAYLRDGQAPLVV